MAADMSIANLKAWVKLTPGGLVERAVAKLIHNHRMLQNQVRWFTKRIVSDANLLAAKAPEDDDDDRRTEEMGGGPEGQPRSGECRTEPVHPTGSGQGGSGQREGAD